MDIMTDVGGHLSDDKIKSTPHTILRNESAEKGSKSQNHKVRYRTRTVVRYKLEKFLNSSMAWV